MRADMQEHTRKAIDSDDRFPMVSDEVSRSVAYWLRYMARGYGPSAQGRFEAIARNAENHNQRMAEKRRMSRPPQRPDQAA